MAQITRRQPQSAMHLLDSLVYSVYIVRKIYMAQDTTKTATNQLCIHSMVNIVYVY